MDIVIVVCLAVDIGIVAVNVLSFFFRCKSDIRIPDAKSKSETLHCTSAMDFRSSLTCEVSESIAVLNLLAIASLQIVVFNAVKASFDLLIFSIEMDCSSSNLQIDGELDDLLIVADSAMLYKSICIY